MSKMLKFVVLFVALLCSLSTEARRAGRSDPEEDVPKYVIQNNKDPLKINEGQTKGLINVVSTLIEDNFKKMIDLIEESLDEVLGMVDGLVGELSQLLIRKNTEDTKESKGFLTNWVANLKDLVKTLKKYKNIQVQAVKHYKGKLRE